MKSSRSNFNLQYSDSNFFLSYLITTVLWKKLLWLFLFCRAETGYFPNEIFKNRSLCKTRRNMIYFTYIFCNEICTMYVRKNFYASFSAFLTSKFNGSWMICRRNAFFSPFFSSGSFSTKHYFCLTSLRMFWL